MGLPAKITSNENGIVVIEMNAKVSSCHRRCQCSMGVVNWIVWVDPSLLKALFIGISKGTLCLSNRLSKEAKIVIMGLLCFLELFNFLLS